MIKSIATVAVTALLSVGGTIAALDASDTSGERVNIPVESYAGLAAGFADAVAAEAVYEDGANSGVRDLCNEVGGTPKNDDGMVWCDMPEVKPEVVTKYVTKNVEVPADTLQCDGGFVAHDVTEAGEWAYCEEGERPAMAQ